VSRGSTARARAACLPASDDRLQAFLTDGDSHDVDSSVLAFEIAARAAFREGIPKAGPRLLEPIMKVEVVTPDGLHGRT